MRVMKFGGSSLASAERISDVVGIILSAAKDENIVVVVSAMQGVSSQLIQCAHMAASGDKEYENIFSQLKDRHHQVIKKLLPKDKEVLKKVDCLLDELKDILHGIALIKEVTEGAMDSISSFGERLSANIIAAFINKKYPSEYVDARKLIVSDDHYRNATVMFDETNMAIRKYYDDCQSRFPLIPVITGYMASTVDGKTTTLGRNSSDYTAAIVGAALDASQVEIWTDVDGVYSADPQFVSNAFVVPRLSYDEAIELSYFGAKILFPKTYHPLLSKKIPIVIKNTFNPEASGTRITDEKFNHENGGGIAKSITSIDDVSLLIWKRHIETDVTGLVDRLFKTLNNAGIKVLLILEGSPKHTLCLAIRHDQVDDAKLAIDQEFKLEIEHNMIGLDLKPSQSIIAIIGDDVKMLAPDISGKMFQALGKVKINVNAIIQGASDRNISLLVDSHQQNRAINLIHQAFFDKYKTLSIVLVGAGRIGSALLDEINGQLASLANNHIKIKVCGVTNSRKMVLDPHGIDLDEWKQLLAKSTQKFNITDILKVLSKIHSGDVALVDCTASDAVPDAYPLFIQEGVHIITPNKKGNVLPLTDWKKLMSQFEKNHTHFLCRTNVGAGLPILTVLEDLLACGDKIYSIEGIFSGTLSYLFNHYDGSKPFSDILKQADDLSMTEPDPREDLSGIDVARKLLILARRMGWEMEIEDVSVESMVPDALQGGVCPKDFYAKLKKHERFYKDRLDKANKDGKVLRYVGVLKDGKAVARLEALPPDHPLALAVYSDNIVAFASSHYHESPLVIRGPGAGIECTTIGVFSDILKLISKLPNS